MKTVSAAVFAGIVACAFVQLTTSTDAGTYRETVLHSFASGSDGANPYVNVIDVNGTLYGTTVAGGSSGGGTVFAFDLSTKTENILYTFCSQHNCTDGAQPLSNLIQRNGTLYGTTSEGGLSYKGDPSGTLFSFDLSSGKERVLYSFCQQQNCPDGSNPVSGLIRVNDTVHGTTQVGGSASYGTVYSLNLKTGTEKVLYSFCSQANCADGQNPDGALIDINGVLYGTTAAGGIYSCNNGQDCGTVFSVDPVTGAQTVLHSFGNAADGKAPHSSLINANGLLYGTTYGGGVTGCGAFGCGTVFSINPNTGVETVLYSFCNRTNCADGANPETSLIDVNGMLYGTTYAGGSTACGGSGCGTVFSVDPNTGAETVLYSFCSRGTCSDGANPDASLIAVGAKLYGTTYNGGASGYGTIFALEKKH